MVNGVEGIKSMAKYVHKQMKCYLLLENEGNPEQNGKKLNEDTK